MEYILTAVHKVFNVRKKMQVPNTLNGINRIPVFDPPALHFLFC